MPHENDDARPLLHDEEGERVVGDELEHAGRWPATSTQAQAVAAASVPSSFTSTTAMCATFLRIQERPPTGLAATVLLLEHAAEVR
jgi:hypothetical protein